MSGVISVGAAIAATVGAASAVASVGLTVGTAFAIVGAVGATVGAIGALTKVKELQIAGAALGAVGLVGGLSSAAGLFGEAGSIFGSATGSALEGIAQGTSAAESASPFVSAASGIDAGTWAGAAPGALSAGYEGPNSVGALMEGQGITAGEIPGFDAIDMANGIPQVNTGATEVATASSPNVTPEVAPAQADTIGGADSSMRRVDNVPGYESPTKAFDQWAGGGDVQPSPIRGDVPDPARSILNNAPIEGDVPRDAFGNVISQGQAAGPTEWANPAAPVDPATAPVNGVAAPKPPGIAGADNSLAGFGSGSTGAMDMTPAAVKVDGVAETGLISNAPTGPYKATLAPESAFPKMSLINGGKVPSTPLEGQSVWGSIGDFIQKNQTLSYGAMQTFGSFISGALKPGTDQTVLDELRSRSASNKAIENLYNKQAEMLQQRMNNMNAPFPMATRQQYGLINGGSAVTGRVG